MTATEYTNARRKAWVKAGLTTKGAERVNKRHPDLAGLTGSDYSREFMKKQRKQDREAWRPATTSVQTR